MLYYTLQLITTNSNFKPQIIISFYLIGYMGWSGHFLVWFFIIYYDWVILFFVGNEYKTCMYIKIWQANNRCHTNNQIKSLKGKGQELRYLQVGWSTQDGTIEDTEYSKRFSIKTSTIEMMYTRRQGKFKAKACNLWET